eukprot:Phypoly_transcript_22678.p1 GENE.Phypoly_transcript_22678~~Phypoly_transcript_22678.p1  ORF type:complete len:160 (+),score=18.75 Phypoly_transcript_22678:83-562(+)
MKYLLAVDESSYSLAAFNHLAKIFNRAEDSLTVIYAIDHKIMDSVNTSMALTSSMAGGPSTQPASVSDGARDAEAVKVRYEEICFEKKIKFDWFQQDGTPIDVIKNYIAKNNVETLVLGTHGKGVLKRAVLGSVSTYFVQHAKIPILVVPSGADLQTPK